MTNPDRWILLRCKPLGEDTFMRVFATWSGSYLYGSSWRLNSGVEKVIRAGYFIDFVGASGSVYRCTLNSYGIAGVENVHTLEALKEKFGNRVETLEEKEAMEWVTANVSE